MATLMQLMRAKKWLELAIRNNKLAYFVIGVPPYAELRPNDAGVPEPVLETNIEVLYDYCKENKCGITALDVENAVIKIVKESGDHPDIIQGTLMFITSHLACEKRGAAKIVLDCPRILEAVRTEVQRNKKKYMGRKEETGDNIWGTITFYDNLFREQYGLTGILASSFNSCTKERRLAIIFEE